MKYIAASVLAIALLGGGTMTVLAQSGATSTNNNATSSNPTMAPNSGKPVNGAPNATARPDSPGPAARAPTKSAAPNPTGDQEQNTSEPKTFPPIGSK